MGRRHGGSRLARRLSEAKGVHGRERRSVAEAERGGAPATTVVSNYRPGGTLAHSQAEAVDPRHQGGDPSSARHRGALSAPQPLLGHKRGMGPAGAGRTVAIERRPDVRRVLRGQDARRLPPLPGAVILRRIRVPRHDLVPSRTSRELARAFEARDLERATVAAFDAYGLEELPE